MSLPFTKARGSTFQVITPTTDTPDVSTSQMTELWRAYEEHGVAMAVSSQVQTRGVDIQSFSIAYATSFRSKIWYWQKFLSDFTGYFHFNPTKNPPYSSIDFYGNPNWDFIRFGAPSGNDYSSFLAFIGQADRLRRLSDWSIFDSTPTWQYGMTQRGDIIGYWIIQELQKSYSIFSKLSSDRLANSPHGYSGMSPLNPSAYNDQSYEAYLYKLKDGDKTVNNAFYIIASIPNTTAQGGEFGVNGNIILFDWHFTNQN